MRSIPLAISLLVSYDSSAFTLGVIIIKRISRAPIYHTRWQHRALYNNTTQSNFRYQKSTEKVPIWYN